MATNSFRTPLLTIFLVILSVVFSCITWRNYEGLPSWVGLLVWSAAQWTPITYVASELQERVWEIWEKEGDNKPVPILEIPKISVQDHDNPLEYLEATYGKDWRDRPLLLQGLWSSTALSDKGRRLSLQGLLRENLTIPFFSDARVHGSLSPDSEAPVYQIVDRMTQGFPHKIGTQLLVQTYPELLQEVAPVDIVTKLFGNHFTKSNLLGHGHVMGIFPGTTTVPVFIANGKMSTAKNPVETEDCSLEEVAGEDNGPTQACSSHSKESGAASTTSSPRPLTGLHCEPIGNVAVQLSGVKEWTLIDPKYSFRLKPSVAPDGRAFFASWTPNFDHVPRYEVATHAGDAMWVPTWTWHRVDYIESDDISIGGSLFHFRPIDYVRQNPLFSLLMIPALVKELAGISSQ